MARFAVVLPAAGKSTRFGGSEKKPFVELAGRAVWLRTAELFVSRPDVAQVLLVVSPEDRGRFDLRYGANVTFLGLTVVNGGSERFESVANALAALAPEVDFVAVHDAVRPGVPASVIDAVFAEAQRSGAALAALPVSDTVKEVAADGQVLGTRSREGLWLAQTPQAARRDWLEAAYAARGTLPGPITDDAQLLEAAGHPVRVVPGSPLNFKITTPDDLTLAAALVRGAAPPEPPPAARRPFDDEDWR
jgi:2-C-methyl-D-erythritol 4-phosphate cytidylyltransferase